MTGVELFRLAIRYDQDVVLTRQRARQLAAQMGFDGQEQTRIATAVSEIARNAMRYAGGGEVVFDIVGDVEQSLEIRVSDRGRGIDDLDAVLSGRYVSSTGMGMGLAGARRLMDAFEISSSPQGTTVVMAKRLPRTLGILTGSQIASLMAELVRTRPADPFEELQRQNGELLQALDELRQRQKEIERLNTELGETNRGVLALYAELDERAESLRRASDLKSRFLSHMSHEFRTPLNSIVSLAGLMMMEVDGPLNDEQRVQTQFIRSSAELLTGMVNDLLDIAKIESGKSEAQPALFSIYDVFGGLRGVFRPMMAGSEVQLLLEPDPGIPSLFTDEGKLSQILRNFISNAVKFTEAGSIRVTAAIDAEEMISIDVTDTGIGIPPESIDLVFEEFVQIPNPLQKRSKGTGLGLPLCRQLAALLGGSVGVASTPGKGSTFSVRIPRVLPGAEAGKTDTLPRAGEPELEAGTGSVLIIDDDPTSRYVLRSFLPGDLTVTEASGAAEGLRIAAQNRFDVIFLDLMMPEMTGYEVLQRLAGDPSTASIPLIVHSSHVLDAEEIAAIESRGAVFLPKAQRTAEEGFAAVRAALERAGLPSRGDAS